MPRAQIRVTSSLIFDTATSGLVPWRRNQFPSAGPVIFLGNLNPIEWNNFRRFLARVLLRVKACFNTVACWTTVVSRDPQILLAAGEFGSARGNSISPARRSRFLSVSARKISATSRRPAGGLQHIVGADQIPVHIDNVRDQVHQLRAECLPRPR